MSAFIVDKAHIDALVRVALEGPTDLDHRRELWYSLHWQGADGESREIMPGVDDGTPLHPSYCTCDALGKMLWNENHRSVAYRYPDEQDGWLGTDHEDVALYRYQHSQAPKLSAVGALKAIRCLDYQSCEHPQWEDSEAKRFLDVLTLNLISVLLGYADAAWEITDQRVFA